MAWRRFAVPGATPLTLEAVNVPSRILGARLLKNLRLEWRDAAGRRRLSRLRPVRLRFPRLDLDYRVDKFGDGCGAWMNAQAAAHILDVETGIDRLDLLERPLYRCPKMLTVRIIPTELLSKHLPSDTSACPVLFRRDKGPLRTPSVEIECQRRAS